MLVDSHEAQRDLSDFCEEMIGIIKDRLEHHRMTMFTDTVAVEVAIKPDFQDTLDHDSLIFFYKPEEGYDEG